MSNGWITRYAVPGLAAGMLIFASVTVFSTPAQKKYDPSFAPSTSDYAGRVAGLGIVEPRSEIISLGTNLQGIVLQVYVKAGDAVKQGAPLFTIDDREAKAQLASAQAKLASAQVSAADATNQYERVARLKIGASVTDETRDRRRYAAELGATKVKEAEAQVALLQTQIARLTVTAPMDSTVLKVNIRPGEFAPFGASTPLMVLGDVSTMHLRVSIDESDAQRVSEQAQAEASLRGHGTQKIPLTFVRRELYLAPKKSLTGEGSERVDTRIQELIYQFDNSKVNAYAGQQMDVFIAAPSPAVK